MNKTQYILASSPFKDWDEFLVSMTDKDQNISYVDDVNDIQLDSAKKIIILDPDIQIPSNKPLNKHLILRSCQNTMQILGDKAMFAVFMMKHFVNNIPKTIYIKRDDFEYIDKDISITSPKLKMIVKPTIGSGGSGVRLIYEIPKMNNNVVISEYIKFNAQYVGHILVNNGDMLKQIYFKEVVSDDPDYIKCGRVLNYDTLKVDELGCDITVFINIFKLLNYSGFACIDFIVVDGKPIIFEINPRAGGSLIHNKKICLEFLQTIVSKNL